MLDHLGIGVTDLEASRRFYEAALAPLGFCQFMTADRAFGFGRGEYPEFWIDAKYRTLHMLSPSRRIATDRSTNSTAAPSRPAAGTAERSGIQVQ